MSRIMLCLAKKKKTGLDFVISDSNLLRFVKRKFCFLLYYSDWINIIVEKDSKNYSRSGPVCIEGNRIRREIERKSGIFKNEIT